MPLPVPTRLPLADDPDERCEADPPLAEPGPVGSSDLPLPFPGGSKSPYTERRLLNLGGGEVLPTLVSVVSRFSRISGSFWSGCALVILEGVFSPFYVCARNADKVFISEETLRWNFGFLSA